MNRSSNIALSEQPMDCCFHPTEPLVAVGLVSGRVQVFANSASPSAQGDAEVAEHEERLRKKPHKESCRALRFMPDGATLLTASADKCIKAVDMGSGKVKKWRTEAHEAGINALLPLAPNQVASGDDDGCVKLWDPRQPKETAELRQHTDYMSDFAHQEQERCLVAVSGDGTLSITDLRTLKVRARSEDDADDELLCCCVAKSGTKVVTGSLTGVLALYSWGFWNDCSDRFPGHPSSVDALAAFDEDTVLSGCQDGLIRVIGILPNKMLGVVGEHGEYPVERLALSGDRRCLASTSHDETLRLWDLAMLHDEGDGEEGAEGEEEENAEAGEQMPAAAAADADSDSEEKPQPKAKRRRKEKRKGGKVVQKQSHRDAAFFADLV